MTSEEKTMRRTICDANYDRLINLGVIAKSGALSGQCRRSELVGLIDSMVERLPHLNGVSGNDESIAASLAHYFLAER